MENKILNSIGLCFLVGLIFLGVRPAAAAAPADLEVNLKAPTSAMVYSPYVYTITVKNIGGSDAAGIRVNVDLPLTDTSPTVHILGTLSGINLRCSVVSNKLRCDFGTIRKNRSASLTFNFALPVSTKVLGFTVSATTTSPETALGNNTVTVVPPLSYATNQLVSAIVLNSHCTGTALTSYFECTLFPSSISEHTTRLNPDGSISFDAPGYTGTWNQPTPQRLYFNYFDANGLMVAEFNGFATTATCFEGLTTFPQSPGYVSPYRVCVQ